MTHWIFEHLEPDPRSTPPPVERTPIEIKFDNNLTEKDLRWIKMVICGQQNLMSYKRPPFVPSDGI